MLFICGILVKFLIRFGPQYPTPITATEIVRIIMQQFDLCNDTIACVDHTSANFMRKAIVTGGAGFIGSNLVTTLLGLGWSVHVIDDFSVGKKTNLPKENKYFRITVRDIRDVKTMQELLKNAEIVFHLATQCVRKSIHDPYLVHSVNTEGTLSVLEASRINRIRKVLYCSSSEIYGTASIAPMGENHPKNPTTMYAASKLAGEFYSLSYLRTYGLPVVIVRPFNTYGYNEHFEGVYGEVIPRFVVRVLNNLPIHVFGSGEQTRDFTFVSDTVEGIISASEKGKIGEVYNIARGDEVSITTLAQRILSIMNKNIPMCYLEERPGDVKRLFADTKKAKKELGFKAKISLETGLRQYINWFIITNPDPKAALRYYEKKNW